MEIFGDGLLGQVVRRGAEAAGSNDEIRMLKGVFQRLDHIMGFVRDFQTEFGHDADFQQPLAHISQVGVDDCALEQFVSDTKHSDFHFIFSLSVYRP